jgi:hypothetical protein
VRAEEIILFPASAIDIRVALFYTHDYLASFETLQTHFEQLFLGLVGIARELLRDEDSCPARDEV